MFRIIGLIVVLGAIASVSIWAAGNEGSVMIDWLGFQFSTNVPVLVLGICLLYLAFYIVIMLPVRMLRAIFGAPAKISAAHAQKKEVKQKIETAVNEASEKIATTKKTELDEALEGAATIIKGLVAALGGDAKTTTECAKVITKELPDAPEGKLLLAMAAEIEENKEASLPILEEIFKNPPSEDALLYAAKVLAETALKNNEPQKAFEYVDTIFATKKDIKWLIRMRFQLLARLKKWDEALKTIEVGKELGITQEERYNRLKATVLVEKSDAAKMAGDNAEAKRLAYLAAETDNTFAPAAILAGKYYTEENLDRKAAGVISRAWRKRPIPELAYAYVGIWPKEDEFVKIQRMEQLSMANSKHPMNQMILAEFNLKAKLWGPARKHLDIYMSHNPTTVKIAQMMAQFEEGGNRDLAAATRWLRDAEKSELDATWTCTECGAHPGEWSAECPNCKSFSTIEWLTPGYTMSQQIEAEEAGKK